MHAWRNQEGFQDSTQASWHFGGQGDTEIPRSYTTKYKDIHEGVLMVFSFPTIPEHASSNVWETTKAFYTTTCPTFQGALGKKKIQRQNNTSDFLAHSSLPWRFLYCLPSHHVHCCWRAGVYLVTISAALGQVAHRVLIPLFSLLRCAGAVVSTPASNSFSTCPLLQWLFKIPLAGFGHVYSF